MSLDAAVPSQPGCTGDTYRPESAGRAPRSTLVMISCSFFLYNAPACESRMRGSALSSGNCTQQLAPRRFDPTSGVCRSISNTRRLYEFHGHLIESRLHGRWLGRRSKDESILTRVMHFCISCTATSELLHHSIAFYIHSND